ncbi:MAG: NAD(P)-dependent oxidoreductase [Candidatus Aminicenantes bacterium]|nr:NAD(P)-dependent oxidoreductase [Candidatus Aminicenantes bacterium]
MPHVLITGATGFIGGHLAERLRFRGTAVTALVRDPARGRFLESLGVRLLHGELDAGPHLPSDLDLVFHLAGMTRAIRTEDYYSVNQKSTASMLANILRQGLRPRFVFLSTIAAGGPSFPDRPRREDDPPNPVSEYGRSKLQGEMETVGRREELPVSVIRVGPVYGPRDPGFLDYFGFIRRGLLLSFGRRPRPMSVCYIDDLVDGLLAAAGAAAGSGEVYNIGDPAPCTFEDLGRIAARILRVRTRRIVLPLPLIRAAVFCAEAARPITRKQGIANLDKYKEYREPAWVADMAKAKSRLGFEAAWSLENGLERTIAWYRETGRL